MSGVICFKTGSEDSWVKAGWAFRQVLEDTAAAYPEDTELAEVFAEAKDIGWLYVDQFDPNLAERINKAMRGMIEDVLSGKIQSLLREKTFGDKVTVNQYLLSLEELLHLMPPPAG